jgi:hypothetical protein
LKVFWIGGWAGWSDSTEYSGDGTVGILKHRVKKEVSWLATNEGGPRFALAEQMISNALWVKSVMLPYKLFCDLRLTRLFVEFATVSSAMATKAAFFALFVAEKRPVCRPLFRPPWIRSKLLAGGVY